VTEPKFKSGDLVRVKGFDPPIPVRICGDKPADAFGRWLVSMDYGGGYLVPPHLMRAVRNKGEPS
jgi:hypothetical protein